MISKKNSLLLLLGATSALFAEQAAEPQSKPNKPLTTYQTVKRDFWDFIVLENLGYKGVSKEMEDYIRIIIKQMNMENYNIEIRSMSNLAKKILGRMNAFVMPNFFAKSGLNYLFVSEEWFNSLPEPEKRALISHEMIHIRNNHFPKKFLVNIVTGLTIPSFISFIYLNSSEKVKIQLRRIPKNITDTLVMYLIIHWYSRQCEKEADIEGAKATKSADGAAQLWQRFINETEDPESRFMIKRVCNKIIIKPLGKTLHTIFGSHPQLQERKKYMEELAQVFKEEEVAQQAQTT